VVRANVKVIGFLAVLLAFSAAADSSVWDYVSSSPRPRRTSSRKPIVVERAVTIEKPVTNVIERVVEIEKIVERPVEKVVERTNVVERVVEIEKAVTNVVDRPVERVIERPVTNVVERPVERIVERPVTNVVERVIERPVTNVVERVVDRPVTNVVERVVDRPVTNVVERVVDRPVTNVVERIVDRPVTNIVERIVDRPVTNIVERIVERRVVIERTNVVEKVVYDHAMEMRLAQDKSELERRGEALEMRAVGLEQRNEELRRELEEERARRERLERALPESERVRAQKTPGRPARITSTSTHYDRKRGIAYFEGKVHVDDENYQMHADKAYVFTTGTNDMRRIVAVGHVAMTNEMRRAYGDKVSYYRQDGMVVLYAGKDTVAEVRDESKADDQTVRGSKIKFWIGSEQIEVLDATISVPRGEMGGMDLL